MKTTFIKLIVLLFSLGLYAQTGHIMQGVGSINMSMGGASTAQPLDISGAMHWNPAAISVFDDKILKFDLGLFFSCQGSYHNISNTLLSRIPYNLCVMGIFVGARGGVVCKDLNIN